MIFDTIKTAFSLKKYPVDLIFEVTSRCNCNCRFCFNRRNLGEKGYLGEELTINEIEKISKKMNPLTWLNITGGEPFLREDLPEISKIFAINNRPRWLSIPTNGLMPEKIFKAVKKILKFTDCGLDINLNLSDIGNRDDENKSKKGAFKELLETYGLLASLKEKKLILKVSTIIMDKNFKNIECINNFVQQQMKHISLHTFILLRGSPFDKTIVLPPLKDLKRKEKFLLENTMVYDGNNKLPIFKRLLLSFLRSQVVRYSLKILETKKQIIPCMAGITHVVMTSEGDVKFCEMLENIGNLKNYNYDFFTLWNSPLAEKCRKYIRDKNCFCTHEGALLNSMVFNGANYPLLLHWLSRYLLDNVVRRSGLRKS